MNENEKSTLILCIAAVLIVAIIAFAGLTANAHNRKFEAQMASQGYELRPVLGRSEVYWQKVKE
jgi:hypothetical protein